LKLTGPLRAQHDELLALASELLPWLEAGRVEGEAEQVHALLGRFLGLVNVHLALEDKLLYARLVTHERREVAELARRFMQEWGSLRTSVKELERRWDGPAKLRARPAEFVRELETALATSCARIERENVEIYDLADRLGL
jgi:hemerythrin-like domain-containing protein